MSDAPGDGGAGLPRRGDPWSVRRGGSARFFAVSTLIHIGVLVAFATLSITAVRELEKIDIQIVEREVEVDHLDLAGTLDNFSGLLNVAHAPRRDAGRARGPRVRDPRAPAMPKVAGPKLGVEPNGAASARLGLGAGGVGGLGGGFGDYVGGLRKIGLDLVLVIDTTESMGFVIDQVKERAATLVSSIQRMVPTSRVGIVIYRDEGDEYVTRSTDLSFRTEALLAFVSQISAEGGGDYPEAVLAGVEMAIDRLRWRRNAKKVVILIGGSPPHSDDIEPLRKVVGRFAAGGGSLSAIDVTDAMHLKFSRWMWESQHDGEPFLAPPKPEHFRAVTRLYGELSSIGRGELVELEDDKQLIRDVLLLTFGKRWELELSKYVDEFD